MINFLLATQRVESTMGITFNRLVRYFLYAGSYLLAVALGAGAGYAMGSFVNSPGIPGLIGAVAGFGLCGYFLHWSRRTRLYQYWAPHLTLFGRLAGNQTIPAGKQQLAYGRKQVKRLFDSPSALCQLQVNCAEVLQELFVRQLNLESIASLPVIGTGLKISFDVLAGPLRDALLTLSLADDVTNPWADMKANLELASSRLRAIQTSLLLVIVMQIIGCALAFTVWYVGIDWLTDHWPEVNLLGWKLLITGLLAWAMYAVFVYPIAVNALLDEILKIKKTDQQVVVSEALSALPAYKEIIRRADNDGIGEQQFDDQQERKDQDS